MSLIYELPSIRVVNGIANVNGLDFFSGAPQDLKQRFRELLVSDAVHLVVTTNADQLIDLSRSATLVEAYKSASLRLVDGKPLSVLAKLLGARATQRITGADLLPLSAEWSESFGWRIAIVGGEDAAGVAAVDQLVSAFPGSKVGHIGFPYTNDMNGLSAGKVVDIIAEFDPDITFVCLGSPKQEEWVLAWTAMLPRGIYIGAGAAIDFAAGSKVRAPIFAQNLGLEWLWRLSQEPQRLWRRYLIKGLLFVPIVIKSLRRTNR